MLATLLALFVIQPSLPGKVHYALLSQTGIQQSDSVEPAQFGGYSGILLADANRTVIPGGSSRQQSIAIDVDREMVRLLAARELNRILSAVEPIAPSELYSINRFRIDNGREAVVYTQLPASLARYREGY